MKSLAAWLAGIGLIGGIVAAYAAAKVEFAQSGERFQVGYSGPVGYDADPESLDPPLPGTPKVAVLDSETFEFGSMMRGAKKSHDFYFRNDGDATLTLKIGSSSCKCTIPTLGPDDVLELEPGESHPVKLEWEAKTGEPHFQQTAEIKTNDPRRRVVRLTIQGTVVETLQALPSELDFANVLASEESTRSTVIINSLGGPMNVTSHEWGSEDLKEHLEVSYRPVEPEEIAQHIETARHGVEVTVTLKPGAYSGQHYNLLRLNTDLEDAPAVELGIQISAIGDITMIGGRRYRRIDNVVLWDLVSSDKGIQEKLAVVVKGQHAKEVELKVADVYPEALVVELGEPRESGKSVVHPLVLKIPPGTEPMSHMGGKNPVGVVKLATTHPTDKEVQVRVRFAVK